MQASAYTCGAEILLVRKSRGLRSLLFIFELLPCEPQSRTRTAKVLPSTHPMRERRSGIRSSERRGERGR